MFQEQGTGNFLPPNPHRGNESVSCGNSNFETGYFSFHRSPQHDQVFFRDHIERGEQQRHKHRIKPRSFPFKSGTPRTIPSGNYPPGSIHGRQHPPEAGACLITDFFPPAFLIICLVKSTLTSTSKDRKS